jgi:hypothetical protein
VGPDVRAKVQQLKECAELAKKFQAREVLFGLEQVGGGTQPTHCDPRPPQTLIARPSFVWSRCILTGIARTEVKAEVAARIEVFNELIQ